MVGIIGGTRLYAAAIPIVLNFDSGGANTFQTALDAAATTAGLTGAGTYFDADIAAIKTAVQTEMTSIYSGLNITFTTVADATKRSTTFGDATASATLFGEAPYNWRNGFLAGTSAATLTEATSVAKIYPKNFSAVLSNASTVAQNEANIEIAVADTAAHELGHTFGLDHQDDYGDQRITPANYNNTGGVQNTHIMATGQTGLVAASRSTPRRFGQLELAKLAQSNNVYVAGGFTPNLIADAGDGHTTRSTAGANAAEPINFQFIPIAGESAVTVTTGSIGAGIHDVYSFTGAAGVLLTADIIARTFPAPDATTKTGTFFTTPASVTLSLWRDNGGTPVQVGATSTDKEYSGNNWLGTPNVDADPMILNQPLPATDTYYLDVLSVGTGAGNYEMFVAAVPEPATLLLAGIGGLVLALAYRRQRFAQVPRPDAVISV